MRVLLVTADFNGASNAISVRSRFNVKALLAHGVEVEVLTTLAPGATVHSDSLVVHGVNARGSFSDGGFVRRALTELVMGFRFATRLWSLRKTYRLVVLTSPPFFTNALCAAACVLLGKPYVLDVRDRYPQVLFDLQVLTIRGVPGRVLLSIERAMYRRAFAVLVATKGLAAQIERDWPNISVAVQRNGFDADAFERFLPVGLREPGPRLRILIHGLFGRMFDVDAFLRIAAYCAKHASAHEFVLAGYGPGLEALLKANCANVTYLGRLDHADILQLLERVDVGLSVHTEQARNSFPVKVFEYIGAGVPCIVIPRSEAGLEVEQAGMGWSFDSSQWQTCAQRLAELTHQPALLGPIVERIRAHRHEFSRQHQAQALLEAVTRFQSRCF